MDPEDWMQSKGKKNLAVYIRKTIFNNERQLGEYDMKNFRVIEVKQDIFADNNQKADELRAKLKEEQTCLINLMSSPGAGKTTTLTRLLETLPFQMGVMEADIDGDCDAQTIEENTKAKVIQLHTGGMCHLDCAMTKAGLEELNAKDLDLVFLENVGNLVCPAEFDTGAHLNMMILSVPEGDDKPLKYPLVFEVCSILIVNKMDVLPYFDFDLERFKENALKRNPNLKIFAVSAKTGEGIPELSEYLTKQVKEICHA